MANSGDKLTTLFRSLGPDDASFQEEENDMAKKSEQRWPLFKSLSQLSQEPTPELSEQERLSRNRQEKSVVVARKLALSLPAINEKLTLSLDNIAKQTGMPAMQPNLRSEQSRVLGGDVVGRQDEAQQLASNNINLPNIKPRFDRHEPIPQLSKPPVVALNLETDPRIFERQADMPTVNKHDLPDLGHADDSLQTIFRRIQGKEKVATKPTEKRSSFFDRLRKR